MEKFSIFLSSFCFEEGMWIESMLRGIIGLLCVIGCAVLCSSDRKHIRWRSTAVGLFLQILFLLLVLKTPWGNFIFSWIGHGFVWFFSFATNGAQFVFGNLAAPPGTPGSLGLIFVCQVLPTIIFFACVMAVLYYIGIMQLLVRGIAWVMIRVLHTSGAETLDVAANTFMGQTEAPLTIRPYIEKMTNSELFTILVSGLAHIGGGVMVAYMQMLGLAYAQSHGIAVGAAQSMFAAHLLTASIIAGPATIVIAKILVPETGNPETMGSLRIHTPRSHSNLLDAASAGVADGVRLVIMIAGMLIAFIAGIALLNALLGMIGDWTGINAVCLSHFQRPLSLELLFGILFQYIAYGIGVPWHDAFHVGSLMGIKLSANEFVAYFQMSQLLSAGVLSEKSIVIATYALCGFANFGSVAILIGGISPLAESRRGDIARLGWKALLGGTLATWMTASIAGMIVS
jgi:CNT family concentrative nucleoside transporter